MSGDKVVASTVLAAPQILSHDYFRMEPPHAHAVTSYSDSKPLVADNCRE